MMFPCLSWFFGEICIAFTFADWTNLVLSREKNTQEVSMNACDCVFDKDAEFFSSFP